MPASPFHTVRLSPTPLAAPGRVRSRIHDDDAVQALGYDAAFVGGPTLFNVAEKAIFAAFGHEFLARGAFRIRFAKPVFSGDAVRVVWDDVAPDPGDARRIRFHLEKQSGEQTSFGWAALGTTPSTLVAPWLREPLADAAPSPDPLPEFPLHAVSERTLRLDAQGSRGRLDWYGEQNPWFSSASPWGPPVLPPCEFLYLVNAARQGGAGAAPVPPPRHLRAPILAGQDGIVRSPLFAAHDYRVRTRTCGKGVSAGSVSLTHEQEVSDDAAGGRVVAVFRTRIRHLNAVLRDRDATG